MRSEPVGVDIVMPTFNCAPWLDQGIESIVAQDFRNWRLIVRDDGSTDGTQERLSRWQVKLGDRMSILADSGAINLGITGNYTALLNAATAAWVMSADPDDVWLDGKIRRSCEAMQQAEAKLGADTPIAVCTDAAVIDRGGQEIAASFWRWSRMGLRYITKPHRVAVESVALGSTMMVNRALLREALPIPNGAPYQDWWFALVAASFGRLIPIAEQTILYRRHENNATDSPYTSTLRGALRNVIAAPGTAKRRMLQVLGQSSAIARVFIERYREVLTARDLTALEHLAQLSNLGTIERRIALLRYDLWFNSPLKNIGLLALL